MARFDLPVVGVRPGGPRGRRGRGMRGPMSLPGPLSLRQVPADRSSREIFDLHVKGFVDSLANEFKQRDVPIEVVIDEAPLLPASWVDEVPDSALTTTASGWRLVLYRTVIITRAPERSSVELLLWQVLINRLSQVWGCSPDDIDPRHR